MNCKPGDLAIITKSLCGNTGKIVEVIKPLGSNPIYKGYIYSLGGDGFQWLVRTKGSPINSLYGEKFDEAPCLDSRLKPISGLPDTEDTDIEQPIKEVA